MPVSVHWSNLLEGRLSYYWHSSFHVQGLAGKWWKVKWTTDYLQNFHVSEMHRDWRLSLGSMVQVNYLFIGRGCQVDDWCPKLAWVRNVVVLLSC